MVMFQGQQVDQTTPSVTVSQDGSGDFNGSDGAIIQEAIDSLTSTGGLVYVKPGTYNVSTPIIVDMDYITLEGIYGGTILSQVGDTDVIQSSGYGFTCSNILVQGDGLGGGTSSAFNIVSDYAELYNCETSNVRGIGFNVAGFGAIVNQSTADGSGDYGFYVFNTSGLHLMNLISTNNASDGMYLDTLTVVGLTGSYVSLNNNYGVYITNCTDLSVLEVISEYSTNFDGFYFTGCSNFWLSNCVVRGNGVNGIYFFTVSNVTLNGCLIYDNLDEGLYLDTANKFIMDSCIIENNNASTLGYYEIGGNGNNQYVTISDNYVSGALGLDLTDSDYSMVSSNHIVTTSTGIYLDGDVNNIKIVGNTITSSAGTGVYTGAVFGGGPNVKTMIEDNLIETYTQSIFLYMTNGVQICDNIIAHNNLDFTGDTIYLKGCDSVNICGNYVVNDNGYLLVSESATPPGYGVVDLTVDSNVLISEFDCIDLGDYSYSIDIRNNVLAVNNSGYVFNDTLAPPPSIDLVFENNDVWVNGTSFYPMINTSSGNYTISNNFVNTSSTLSATATYFLYDDGSCSKCVVSGNNVSVECTADVLYYTDITNSMITNNLFNVICGSSSTEFAYIGVGDGVNFSGNTILKSGTQPLQHIVNLPDSSDGCRLDGNTVYVDGSSTSVFNVVDKQYSSICGNIISQNTSSKLDYGIFLSSSSYCNVNSNIIKGVSGTAAINLFNTMYTCVNNNNIRITGGTVTYGVYESGSADYNMINGNIARSASTGYLVSGSNTIYGSNGSWV